MSTREEIFRKLLACLDEFARLTGRELYNDVTAEQQIALRELQAALIRAREMCRACALAFEEKEARH